MTLSPTKLVLTCTGNVADEDLEERLAKIKTTLQKLSQTDKDSVNLSKVEPWNSVRVTFNIPPEAAARLRELAQRGDINLHKLGILTVQVENGDPITLPPPPTEAQRSLFSPVPSTPPGVPHLPPGPPIIPPSPTPVVSSPTLPASTPTPATMVPGPNQGGSGTGPNFPMPGVSLQQLTRPSLQGLPTPGPVSLFPQQGGGNLWNSMGVPQQRPLQPPGASFWNQIPQFFNQVNMPQANQPQGMPPGPPVPPAQQPKPQPKKRRKRTKKANIQPPDLAVAAGQPLLPLPPHLQSLPPPTTNTQENDNFNTNKPSNLTLPPSLIDNPISPNTPPSTGMATSSTTSAPVITSSASTPSTQFSFTDIPVSRGLVPSPLTQQQLLQKKTDVALTSPLLVNLLQSDISSKQFPFSNSAGSKTTSTGTDTPTTGQPGPPSQELPMTASTTGINTSSPFMLGNGLSTLATPNTAIPNLPPFLASQANMLSHMSTSGQFLPTNTLSQAQTGQLSQDQVQFQLSQLSAVQISQVQASHTQSLQGPLPQNPILPGQNQIQPGHVQPFQMPGGHHLPGPPFPGPMPHNQLPNARMSIGPVTTQDQIAHGQMRLGGPTHMGQMPRGPILTDRGQFQLGDMPLNQGKGQQPTGQLHSATSPFVSANTPTTPLGNPLDTWNSTPSAQKEKHEMQVDSSGKKTTQTGAPDTSMPKPGSALDKSGDDSKKPEVPKPPEEAAQVFDEEAALLGMTEAERDTMAAAAIIAKEAKMAADAKNGKQQQSKDASPPKSQPQPSTTTAATSGTTGSSTDVNVAFTSRQSASSPGTASTRSFPESQISRPSSRGASLVPSVTDRRSSNSPVRLSPPKMPETVKQRRTPPSSTSRPVHQQVHYGPISGSPSTSMSSGIAGLQTLTSRTFPTSTQPSIRDMALSRNPEHNTLSQFLSSVTPPSEILQMAPLFRSNKQQEPTPKSTASFPPSTTAVSNDWLSLPSVDTQKPLPLPAQIGARTPMQPAEFSAATERMLGSMLDTQKPGISNIERPPNQPRVITSEGIDFMHKLVGRTPPSNPLGQGPSKDVPAVKSVPQEQTSQNESAKKDDKSQLKALLNEIVIPETCPFEKQLLADDSKTDKPQATTASSSKDSVTLSRQPSAVPQATLHTVDQWFGFTNPAMSLAQAAPRKIEGIPQASNITSIYIPPPFMGAQQQQTIYSQPATTAEQPPVSCNIASTTSASESTNQANRASQSRTQEESDRSQLNKDRKTFTQASPSLHPSQSISTFPQAMAGQTADTPRLMQQESLSNQTAEGSDTISPIVKLPTQSLPSSMMTKSPISQRPPSLPETPMTVLERAPQILLSPATLSTASQELIQSLGAHGTVKTLLPTSEAPSAAKTAAEQVKRPTAEQPSQQSQESAVQKPANEIHPSTEPPQSTPEEAPPSADTGGACLQANVPETSTGTSHPLPVTPLSSTPTMHLPTEQQTQHSGVTTQVDTTVTETVAPNMSVVPTTAFDVAALSSAPVQPTSAVADLKQMSKLTLSQLVAASHASLQAPGSQPETSITSTQPASLIPQQPSVQGPTPLQDTVLPAGETENISPPSQSAEPVSQPDALRLKSPGHQQSYFSKMSPEKTSRSSPEKLKQLELDTISRSVVSEADNTQHLYRKAPGDKLQAHQQLRTSPGSITGVGHPTVSPTTTPSPVKPTAFSSASSTLVQAQSIMVKTRTSGILKATEQMSRPVRSRTPPRASLSALPPTTCNNDSSLGSASALLSSIAKSAWTVTTAMASAAKAKVVPTPKATDKNLTRMRRSPETLPPAGKMATGDRDRGSSSQDASNNQTQPVPGLATVKNAPKTATSEPSTETAIAAVKSDEGNPSSNYTLQAQLQNLAAMEAKEQTASTISLASSTAVTTYAGEVIQLAQPPASIPSSRPDIQYEPPEPLPHPLSSSPPSSGPTTLAPPAEPLASQYHPSTGLKSTTPPGDSAEDKTTWPSQQLPPLSSDTHGIAQPQHKAPVALSPVDENSKPKTCEEEALKDDCNSQEDRSIQEKQDPHCVSFPSTGLVTDRTTTVPTVTEDSVAIPMQETSQVVISGGPMVLASVGDRTETPEVEASQKDGSVSTPVPTLQDRNLHDDSAVKSAEQQSQLRVSTSPKELAAERRLTVSPTRSQVPSFTGQLDVPPVPVPAVRTNTDSARTQITQPSISGPLKRPHSEESEDFSAKHAKDSSSHLSQPDTKETKLLFQQEREAEEKPSIPVEMGVALPSMDVDITEKSPPAVPAATPQTPGEMEQHGPLKDRQEGGLPVATEISPRESPKAPDAKAEMRTDQAPTSERRAEDVQERTSESRLHQDSHQSLEESVAVKTDDPPEALLLNKPDQVTSLAEETARREVVTEDWTERISPSTSFTDTGRHETQGQEHPEFPSTRCSETHPEQPERTETAVKPSDKDQSKDGGLKMGRDLEGEFGPRRTRHTSEEVAGMSTRSLRSGRRSPAEPVSKGKEKEKEESPPTTRGRGQKEKEVGGETDADALSRKRSTRSSGRGTDMYYGPIPSYKRRKTNQK